MTAQEIVRALRCCKLGVPCEKCPVVGDKDCFDEVNTAAAELIERLTAENADLRKEIEWKGMVIALAQRKQAEAEAERDALREYAKLFTGCDTCRHGNYCKTECLCDECEQDVKGNCYYKDCIFEPRRSREGFAGNGWKKDG